jgi:hypothetical protein
MRAAEGGDRDRSTEDPERQREDNQKFLHNVLP